MRPAEIKDAPAVGLRQSTDSLDFLVGGGEMGAILHAHDWSGSSLGQPETWPRPLRTMVRFMLNSRHPMYIWWGADGACLYNDAYRASIGSERHPCSLGQPVRQVWAEIWNIIGPQIEQIMAGGPPTWHENQLVPITRNGRLEDVYWTYSYGPIDDPAGPHGIGGVLVVCTETTATVLAEQARATKTDRQQRLLDQAPGFMAMLDGPEHRFSVVNSAYMRLAGDRDVIGRTVAQALPGAVARGLLDLLDTVFRTGKTVGSTGAEYTLDATPGHPLHQRYADFVYQPVTGPDGRVTGIVVQGHDVTERTLAARAVCESEARLREVNAALEQRAAERTAELLATRARLRTIFETSFQLQGLLALDGTLLEVNAAALAVIGAPAATVIGKPFWESPWFSATPGMPDIVRAAVAAAAAGECVRREVSVQLHSGLRTFDFSLRPIHHPSGAVIAIVPEAVDVTDRRIAAEALRQSRKLEAMGQLTGGVAHDFNNLLTPIIGSLDMLMCRGIGSERERRLIAAGMQSAERAKTLVQRLLAFARRHPPQAGAVDVGKLIAGMTNLLASTLGPRIAVTIDLADSLPAATADPNQLEMALLNLCVNARDAMANRGSLRLSAIQQTVGPDHPSNLAAGTYVCIAVADTGAGMDDETARRAIEPFFSTKAVGEGTGLGLSMVHGLATQLGGGLTIASKPGLGTTIELWLPVSESAPPATTAPNDPHRPARKSGTVLLVDDEDLVRVTTAEMLTDLGFAVIEAASAEAALHLLDSGVPIDVVITDHLMPGMTGIDLARVVNKRQPVLPVVIVSGVDEVDKIAPGLPRLNKPFRQADLAAILTKLPAAGQKSID